MKEKKGKELTLLNELERKGVEPYPYEFRVTHSVEQVLKEKNFNKTYNTAGRILTIRDFGRLLFADLYSNGLRLQISASTETMGEKKLNEFKEIISPGDVVSVSGRLFRTKKGELTLGVKKFKLLAKCLRDVASHKWFGLKDEELRYRQRYRDLIVNPNVLRRFILRSNVIKEIRLFLDDKGFIEVETPILQPIYGGANARPFKTYHNSLKRNLYLRISPELYLKRLTIGGMERVYEVSRVFRNEGIDTKHNPEFTMLELYQAYADYTDMMKLTEELFKKVTTKVFKSTKFSFRGKMINLKPPFKRLTMINAIKKYARINVNDLSAEDIKKILNKEKVEIPLDFNWGLGVQALFEHFVEPKLVQPVFITDHPKETTPLCKPNRKDKRLIERFELFINGVEIANAYTELNDPRIQEEFFNEQVKRRRLGDVEAHEFDSDFIEALKYGLPPTGGLGVGIDRLVMILTSTDSIRDVILFPTLKEKNQMNN